MVDIHGCTFAFVLVTNNFVEGTLLARCAGVEGNACQCRRMAALDRTQLSRGPIFTSGVLGRKGQRDTNHDHT